jgi:hypothetical protein
LKFNLVAAVDLSDSVQFDFARIAALLRDNASDDELIAYLKWAEVENMGLGTPEQFDSHSERILGVIAALRKVGPPHRLDWVGQR